MATTGRRLRAAGCEEVWKNKINEIAQQRFGYAAAKLMHISAAAKVLVYNWIRNKNSSERGCTSGPRQPPPLDGLPVQRRAPCEPLWVWYLAQGFLGSVTP